MSTVPIPQGATIGGNVPIPDGAQIGTAGDRFMGSTGLTTGGRNLAQQVGYEASQTYHHPLDTAKETVTAPVTGYAQAANDQFQRMKDHWNSGDHTGALVHGLYYLLTPVGGANLGRAADQAASGDIAGAAGSMALPTAGMAVSSPAVRSGVGTAVNAARTGTAAAVDAAAKPVANIATGVTAAHEFVQGRPLSAAFALDKGKPFITKGMNAVASILKPGQAPIEAMPLTRQVLGSEAFQRFLNAPGIEGEAADTGPGPARNPDGSLRGLPPGQYAMPAAPPQVIQARIVPAQAAKNSPPVMRPPLALPPGQYEMPGVPNGATPPDYMMNAENEAADKSIIGRHLPPASTSQFLSGLRDHAIIQRINAAFTKQEGAGESTVQQWIVDHDQNAPGGKSGTYLKAAKNSLGKDASQSQVTDLAMKLKRQDTDMAGMLQESLDKIQSGQQADTQTGRMASLASRAEQGGHAGGGVTSVEELSRPGINYIINKSGKLTYHGKSFAPEETPAGGTHVTVFPDGKFRVNNGVLTESQALMLRKAINEK